MMRIRRIDPKHGFLVLPVTFALLVGLFRGHGSLKEYSNLSLVHQKLDSRVKELQQEISDIRLEIDRVKASPDYARKIHKDRYHSVEEGEILVPVHVQESKK